LFVAAGHHVDRPGLQAVSSSTSIPTRTMRDPGPVIVICRHVSIVDASLPTLLYQQLATAHAA